MKIYITGDGSRHQYLKKLVGISAAKDYFGEEFTVENKDIHIVNSSNLENTSGKIVSRRIPLNTEVVIAGNTQVTEDFNIDELESYDRILIFDEYPYRTDIECKRIDSISENYDVQNYEIVLIKKEEEGLKSDISTAEEAMLSAKMIYEEDGHKVITYSIVSEDKILEFPQSCCRNNLNKRFKKRLQSAMEKLDSGFDIDFLCDYSIGLKDEITNPGHIDSYISIDKIQNKKVRDVFIKGFSLDFFGDNSSSKMIRNFVEGLYRKYTKEIAVWDIDRDINLIYNDIGRSFFEKMKSGWDFHFSGSDTDYIMFKNIYNENIVELKQSAISFFEVDMPVIIKNKILDRIKRLEELLYD
jgi:hypothetical protein|nr:hypothetical protein [uncultured Lachnoanaerobaculum sp.]